MKKEETDRFEDRMTQYVGKALDWNATWSVAHSLRFLMVTKTILKHSKSSKVLDVGFGSNLLAEHLHAEDFNGSLIGLDFNKTYVNRANRIKHKYKFKSSYFNTSVEVANKIYSKYFSAIVLGEVIEHLIVKKDTEEFLLDVKKLLKDDGKIILTTPNMHNNTVNWPSGHLYEFSYREIRQLFKKVGLKVVFKCGLWNNTKGTYDSLGWLQKRLYNILENYIHNSILNTVFNFLNIKKSRHMFFVLEKI